MGGVGWDRCVNDWVGALSTIHKEHLRVIVFYFYFFEAGLCKYSLHADRCTILSREHLRVMVLYVFCIYVHSGICILHAVRCTIMKD